MLQCLQQRLSNTELDADWMSWLTKGVGSQRGYWRGQFNEYLDSLTVLPNSMSVLLKLMKAWCTGTINHVNHGCDEHTDILEIYKSVIDPPPARVWPHQWDWHNMMLDDLNGQQSTRGSKFEWLSPGLMLMLAWMEACPVHTRKILYTIMNYGEIILKLHCILQLIWQSCARL